MIKKKKTEQKSNKIKQFKLGSYAEAPSLPSSDFLSDTIKILTMENSGYSSPPVLHKWIVRLVPQDKSDAGKITVDLVKKKKKEKIYLWSDFH